MSLALVALVARVASAATPAAEAERLARVVAELLPRAEAIEVDGRADDWAGLYRVRAPEGAVRSIAVAPTDAALKVVVELAEPLGSDEVWLAMDLGDGPQFDGALRVAREGTKLRVFGQRGLVAAPAVTTAVDGGTVEIVARWADLAALVPPEHALANGPGDRVRVRASRWSRGDKGGPGLAVASYRLSPRVRFDPPPPPSDRLVVLGELPVVGTWYVAQGAQSGRSHVNAWAYDLTIRDAAFHARSGDRTVSHVLCWDQPIYAPKRGTVKSAIDGFADQPLDTPGKSSEANRVRIDFDDGTRMTALHLRNGSVAVRQRERVAPGQVVGRVGNSGKSSGPHVHLAWATRSGVTSPARWVDVVVSLNPTPDDPWQRSLDAWDPSAGFFVRRAHDLGTTPQR